LCMFYTGIKEREDEDQMCVLYLTASRNRNRIQIFSSSLKEQQLS